MMIDELIARLSAATGSDRKIDYMIQQHLDGKPIVEIQTWWTAHGFVSLKTGEDGHKNMEDVPRYTASLDAAMTLASDGEEYEIANLYGVAMVTLPLNRSDVSSITVRRPDGNVVLAFVQCAMAYRVALRALNSEPSR